ncbi:hypothetical protein [Xanthomonas phage RTH11]|nr:hypothetical protein [Xanthomonas phage RTH11]
MRNTLGMDLALLANGDYGRITAWNEKQVTERLRCLINYHHEHHLLTGTPDVLVLQLSVAALVRDLPEVAKRMHIEKLMEGLNEQDTQLYRDCLLSSLVNNLETELIGIQTDKEFFNLLRQAQLS